MALESGHVVKPSNGWYSKVDVETGEISEKKYRAKDTDTKDFWMPLISSTSFQQWIKENYQVSNGAIISDDDIASELEAIEDVL